MIQRILAAIACLIISAGVAVPVTAQTSTPACDFILGFKTLHELVPADVGGCLDNQAFAANGDALQHTTGGLLVWRKADNWTAFTNGYMTWINGPTGLVSRLNSERFPWEEAAAPSPTPVAAPSPPFNVTFDAGVSPQDRSDVLDGLGIANSYFISTFGQGLTGSSYTLDVRSSDPGSQYVMGYGQLKVTLFTAHATWLVSAPYQRKQLVARAAFHLLQQVASAQHPALFDPLNDGLPWLFEGTADVAAWHAVAARGLVDFERVRQCNLGQAPILSPPHLAALSAYTVPQVFTSGGEQALQLAFDAVDMLTAANGVGSLLSYYSPAPQAYRESAFRNAFAVDLNVFNARFEQFRANLGPSSNVGCVP